MDESLHKQDYDLADKKNAMVQELAEELKDEMTAIEEEDRM